MDELVALPDVTGVVYGRPRLGDGAPLPPLVDELAAVVALPPGYSREDWYMVSYTTYRRVVSDRAVLKGQVAALSAEVAILNVALDRARAAQIGAPERKA